MNPSIANELVIPAPKPKTPPGESELQQFAKLLDQFFAKLGI